MQSMPHFLGQNFASKLNIRTMKKFFLGAILLALSVHLFPQSNYGEDEWGKQSQNYNEQAFYEEEKEETDEDIYQARNEGTYNSSFSATYLSKMYFEGIFNFNARLANQQLTSPKSEGEHSRFKITSHLNTYLASPYYEAFLSFKSNKQSPLDINTASLRLSPLLMQYPKQGKLIPLLSFYIGSFRTPFSFRHLYNVSFLQVSPTSKRRSYPDLNNIKLSKTKANLGTAFEVALPFFNFYFFWKTSTPKNINQNGDIKNSHTFLQHFMSENANEFNLYAAFKTDKLMSKKAKLNIALLSSFVKNRRSKKNDKNIKDYVQLYAIDFNFSHPFLFFNSLNSISFIHKQRVDSHSLAFREEGGLSYKIFHLNTGFSYEGWRYLALHTRGKKNFSQKDKYNLGDIFTFYLQEQLKWKIFSTSQSYSLLKQLNEDKFWHRYGFFYSIGNKLALFKNELLFFKEVYSLKFSFTTHPKTYYFRAFTASSTLYLQNKNINPNIIKKYEVGGSFVLYFTQNFYCKIDANIFQKTLRERREWKWKKEVFSVTTSFFFLFAQERWKEKGSLAFKYSSDKNSLDILLKIRFEY